MKRYKIELYVECSATLDTDDLSDYVYDALVAEIHALNANLVGFPEVWEVCK